MDQPKRQIIVNRSAMQASRVKNIHDQQAKPEQPGPEKVSRFHALMEPGPTKQRTKGTAEKIEHRRFILQLLSAFAFVVGLWFAVVLLMTDRPLQAAGLAIATVYATTRARSSCECSQCRGRINNKAVVCQHCKAEFQ